MKNLILCILLFTGCGQQDVGSDVKDGGPTIVPPTYSWCLGAATNGRYFVVGLHRFAEQMQVNIFNSEADFTSRIVPVFSETFQTKSEATPLLRSIFGKKNLASQSRRDDFFGLFFSNRNGTVKVSGAGVIADKNYTVQALTCNE